MEKQTKPTMGQTISALRKAHGMTQAELADQLGVTDKAVSKWERDLSCPDLGSLPRLAALLEVSVDALMQVGDSTVTRAPKSVGDTVTLVCKAVALAMGVAVVVLSAMNALDPHTGVTLLGVGLTCAGVCLLRTDAN